MKENNTLVPLKFFKSFFFRPP